MRELQVGDAFSRAAPKEQWAPPPPPPPTATATRDSFECAPRVKNRAAAAIAVVVTETGRAYELNCDDRLEKRGYHSAGEKNPVLNRKPELLTCMLAGQDKTCIRIIVIFHEL